MFIHYTLILNEFSEVISFNVMKLISYRTFYGKVKHNIDFCYRNSNSDVEEGETTSGSCYVKQ